MKINVKGIIKYTVSLIVAGVFVYFAFRSVDWDEFWDGFLQTKWGFVALYFVASIAALVFRAYRWQALIKPLDNSCRRMAVWDANNVGNLVNVVLPGSGELLRCAYMRSPRASFEKVFGTVLMERIWDIMAMILLLVAVLGVNWERFGNFFIENLLTPMAEGGPGRMLIALAVVVLLVFAVWAVYHFRNTNALCGKIASKISGLGKGLSTFRDIRNKWLFAFYTFGIWMMYTLMTWFIMLALPAFETCSFVDALFVSAVGNFAAVIPVPGGIGAYHFLVALTLSSLYGASWDAGILFATMSHELHALLIIVLGVISYAGIALSKKQKGL